MTQPIIQKVWNYCNT